MYKVKRIRDLFVTLRNWDLILKGLGLREIRTGLRLIKDNANCNMENELAEAGLEAWRLWW